MFKPTGRRSSRGFTLIELMTALTLAVVVGMAVYYMYSASISAYTAAEKELQFLAGFRTATDLMEREVNSMCWKAGYLPITSSNPGQFKAVNDGMLRTHFFPHCAAFYTSLDGVHIDWVAYYFNPPEPAVAWEDGEDTDDDDPDVGGVLPPGDPRSGMYLLIDDKGSMMRQKRLDRDIPYDEYANDFSAILPDFSADDVYTGSTRLDSRDLGDIMSEGFDEIKFYYVYSKPGDRILYYTEQWPHDSDTDTSGDDTGITYFGKGLSYLTVPLGIQIDFHYELEGADRVLSKLMLIYASKWHEMSATAAGP